MSSYTVFKGNRLIPARAGNTSRSICRGHVPPAHPRSRGEHDMVGDFLALYGGSSPLARGTLEPDLRPGLRSRLIPARAGNTLVGFFGYGDAKAHPRSRGEHTC